MYEVVLSNHFKKDLKLAIKRGLDLNLLDEVVECLAGGEKLAPKHRDHALTGNYSEFRECHIQPNWLLVYRIEESDLILFLFRTGTHSDLF